jgi:hypothetical protein
MIELPPKPHIYKPYRPLDPPRASADDLAQPSQWVRVRNTSPAQTHIVIDRYKGGHTLAPGEACTIEMTVQAIEYFRQQRNPDRFFADGRRKPLHPILIEDVPPLEVAAE